jgi:thioredoxin 1
MNRMLMTNPPVPAATRSGEPRALFARMLVAAMLLLAALFAGPAGALTLKPYSPEAVKAAQAKGQAIALHFHADWCPTCRAQQSVLRDLEKAGAPAVTVFVVDYDRERALRSQKKVRSQSTLIVYRGTRETGRIAGETGAVAIKAVLQTASMP